MIGLDLLVAMGAQTFWVVYEGAVFILLGFAIAGVVHVALDPARIVRHLGERSLRSAALAALLGAPLPLCSCGVLPMAVSLRRKGASREATLAFLITTPETGVDSLAMTLAYCGPGLAIVRPIVAIATALVAAVLSLRDVSEEAEATTSAASTAPAAGLADEPRHDRDASDDGEGPLRRMRAQVDHAAQYAFSDLFDELGFWMALAFVSTGVLGALLPTDFFVRAFPSSFTAMIAIVVLGAPIYVCASASTPLAALLLAKGATAGTALVFLLVGPATNAAALATVGRILGGRAVRLYVGTIIGIAIAAGLVLDVVAPGIARPASFGAPTDSPPLALVKLVAATAFIVLLLASFQRTGIRPGWKQLVDNLSAALRWARSVVPMEALRGRPVQGIAALWLLSIAVGACWRVPVGHQALVRRFGRLVGPPHEPGLVIVAPIIDRVDLVAVDAVRERAIGYHLEPGSLRREPDLVDALHLTADENVIDVHVEAQYRVTDSVQYRLGVEAPDDVLAALVRARLVETLARRPIDRVYTDERAAIETQLARRVRHDAHRARIGIDVLAVRLLDVHAPATVHDAFRDVASAHEDRLTKIHRANEYALSTVAVARGDASRILAEAEGFAAERRARAAGDANAFAALAAEHGRSPAATETRLYIEAAERVLPGARKIVRPTAGAGTATELWLRGGAPGDLFSAPSSDDDLGGSAKGASKEWSPP